MSDEEPTVPDEQPTAGDEQGPAPDGRPVAPDERPIAPDDGPALRAGEAVAGEIIEKGTGGITFAAQELVLGQRISVTTDGKSTQAIQAAIDGLAKVPGDLVSILQALFGGDAPKQPYAYDASADWLVGFSLTYGVVTFDVLLVDGEFYGLLLKIVRKPPPPPAKDQPFAGLSLEILYRKVNDHLGEFSADLTLPGAYRKLTFGKAPAATIVTLPAVGVAVWTNGDFKVSVGWPLGDRSFSITFPPDPIPWSGGGGLYFAKLRSEDAAGLGTDFDTILQFGIGLRIGAATEGDYSILKWGASLYLFGSFQGFLAWQAGHPISGGVDYYWFCATVGITGHLEGTVDFVVVKVTVSLDVTASATLALESEHSATAQVEFTATVKATVKILFFSVSFSYTLDLQTQIQFGSGPPAKITGPSPPSLAAARSDVAALDAAVLADAAPPADGPSPPGIAVRAAAVDPVVLQAHLLLQPTIRQDAESGSWLPVGVATLVLDRPAPGAEGAGTDGFSQLVARLASFALQTYGGYADPAAPVTDAEVAATLTALDKGTFDLAAVYSWLDAAQVSFTVTGAAPGTDDGDVDAVVLPMIPGLELTYAGTTTAFGDAAPPPGYAQVLTDYFAKLSFIGDGSLTGPTLRAAAAVEPAPSWFPGLVFVDAFNLLAKQLVQDVGDAVGTGTLAEIVAGIDVGNLAGTLSRFLQYGQRLPDPTATGPVEEMPTAGLQSLTGQQFDVAGGGEPVLDAVVAVGTSRVAVTVEGDGTATLPFALTQPPTPGPLATPRPMERIKQVPVSYLLEQGYGWVDGTTQPSSAWTLFDLPGQLGASLRTDAPLVLGLSATTGAASSPVHGVAGQMIRFAVAPVPGEAAGSSVLSVTGPDEATRDLIELLLASPTLADQRLSLLLPLADGSYATAAGDAGAIILRTDLSTTGGPALHALFADALQERTLGATPVPALGPTSAPITATTDFLRLLWECSVVHNAGFFLDAPGLDVSSGARSYDVALLVTDAQATPSPSVTLDAERTTVLVQAADVPAGSRVQAALYDADGVTPRTQPQPGYPAGAIAFETTWSSTDSPPVPSSAVAADTAEYATALYQLLTFRLPGDDVLQPSAWSMPLGPDGDDVTWTYRRAVPVARFVTAAQDAPNRYAAIGHPTTIQLQLLDVFGNAATLDPLVLTAVYDDPLVPLDEWPGTTATYAFDRGAAGEATLAIEVAFDPTLVDQPATALIAYGTILDQLDDARTSISVTTAMAADAVTVRGADGADAKAALADFVRAVAASLDGGTTPAPAPLELSGTIPTAYAGTIGDDLFPIWATVELVRDAPTETVPYSYPPGYLATATQLALRLDGSSPDAALRGWAIGFEAAFAGYAAAGDLLKVLAGSPPTKVTATRSRLGSSAAGDVPSVPGDVWALRWSPSSGVDVTFPNAAGGGEGAPVYFTAMPLSTQLVGGSVVLSDYDANGVPTPQPAPTTFSAIDLDGWAAGFLAAVDALLAPDLACALARLSADDYAALMTAKEDLAYAIASGVSWVFADQLDAQAGDLGAAQTALREGLLGALAADFATSAIAQVPATLSVAGQIEPDDEGSRAPELFGSPTPVSGATAGELEEYRISSAALPLVAGPGNLTFLVGSVSPTTRSDLSLTFDYDVGFLDHAFHTSAEQFGYVPSSWLRFVVPDVDPAAPPTPALDVAMGGLDVPIPLRAYPSPPRLVGQQAVGPASGGLAGATQMSYELTVAAPGVAQDDLHLAVLFNGASDGRDPAAAATGPGVALLAPLARFRQFAETSLETAVAAIEAGSASAAQWATDVIGLVQDVATTWLDGGAAAVQALAADDDAVPPMPWSWELRLRVPDETTPNVIVLDWIGADPASSPVWPTVEGTTGTAISATSMRFVLPSTADAAEPTLAWSGLRATTAQSITTAAWIVRNETLAASGGAGDRATNPGLVYATPTVTFPDPVVPLNAVPAPIAITSTALSDGVAQLVSGVLPPNLPATQVGWTLEASYSFVLVDGDPGALRATLPAFLTRATVSTAETLPGGVESVADLTAAITTGLRAWYDAVQPAGTDAALTLALTLFSSRDEQPLVRLTADLPIPSAGWWAG